MMLIPHWDRLVANLHQLQLVESAYHLLRNHDHETSQRSATNSWYRE